MFQHVEESFSKHTGQLSDVVAGPDVYRTSGKFELLDRILPKLKATGITQFIFIMMADVLVVFCRSPRVDVLPDDPMHDHYRGLFQF